MSLFVRSTPPSPASPSLSDQDMSWLAQQEGQLAVDVFRDGNQLVVRTALAGVDPNDLDIAIDGDLLTIRGQREQHRQVKEQDFFVQECYWGSFSRSLVLPLDVLTDQTQATLRNGLLEIRLPIRHERRVPIRALD